jgi:hypothetical protein
MLYPENNRPRLDEKLFKSPTSEYRGTPFWAWNCDMTEEMLILQIDYFKEMGFGGFHMHSRTGMAVPYLGKRFMELVKACVRKAKDESMLAWLYDEDRWPSGAAGGLVTKNQLYRARHLLFTANSYNEQDEKREDGSADLKTRLGNGKLLARYEIVLDDKGCLNSYHLLKNDESGNNVWYAYLEVAVMNPWFNNQAYVNTLDKKAIDEFIRITYETYKDVVGIEFGKTVPAIFTDEPQFRRKTTLAYATDKQDLFLPWADDLTETYRENYSQDLMSFLPELFWELPECQISVARYRYHQHVAKRFVEAFADNCGQWCRDHHLMLTGHMMEEHSLESQTAALGEAMLSYRAFDLPGIDILCDRVELTTAKQAQSAVHQFGYCGMLSELYGVTNWDFDFRGHKLQGDWQAALGVTVRVPHLSWVSMEGEAKRDYPASIHYQSPWYKEYALIENHFARINTALTRGKPLIRVGVIHPVESYWLLWGPSEQTASRREKLEYTFQSITSWLLFGTIDFDFISEALLPEQCTAGDFPLQVGTMRYDVVIIPACITLRSTTVSRLRQFSKKGGKIIVLGNAPVYLDACPAESELDFLEKETPVSVDKASLLEELECVREIDIRTANGSRTADLLTSIRSDNDSRWVFIAHGRKPHNQDIAEYQEIKITLPGIWNLTRYDSMTGNIHSLPSRIVSGNTVISYTLYAQDSLLFSADSGYSVNTPEQINRRGPMNLSQNPNDTPLLDDVSSGMSTGQDQMRYELSEPNVLLLDMAEFALDDGEYEPEEEILRIDNRLRRRLSWQPRVAHIPQPWVVDHEKPSHRLKLRFVIKSKIQLEDVALAMEKCAQTVIRFNGEMVEQKEIGYFADESIRKVVLPPLKKGSNILELDLPYGESSNPEWCYLLGRFGVQVRGTKKMIIAIPDTLGFGDLVPQGFPFYGGNITYKMRINGDGRAPIIKAPYYRGALVGVELDGKRVGSIAFSPYECELPVLSKGEHELGLTLFGTRINTFGTVHNCDRTYFWYGPNAWRTTGDQWSYEYVLKETGILKSPELKGYVS